MRGQGGGAEGQRKMVRVRRERKGRTIRETEVRVRRGVSGTRGGAEGEGEDGRLWNTWMTELLIFVFNIKKCSYES